MADTTGLHSPLILKNGIEIPNRFCKAAMSEQLGDASHNPTPGLEEVYRRWAEGGVGLNISGNIMIDRSALGEPRNVVLDESSDLSAFKRWTAVASAKGGQFWAQLNHPGKQTPKFLSKEPVAPSAIALGAGLEKTFATPRALTEQEIISVIDRFALSAKLAKEVGFTGVQIHGAHGYLVSQFLSPRHNQRQDRWGGNAENRMRFVMAIYEAIRTEVGNQFPVGIKLNSADFMKDGFSEEESMQVVEALSEAGIDLIEISGGTYEVPSMIGNSKQPVKESTKKREAYFIGYAEAIRRKVSTPLIVTGGFRSAKAMQEALSSGATDMIGLARTMALDPALPNKVMSNPDFQLQLKKVSTGFKGIDKMIMLDLVWFEQQIHRMSQGKDPSEDLSPWGSVWMTLSGIGVSAFRQRRA